MILRTVWILLGGALALFCQEDSFTTLSKSLHKPIPLEGAILQVHEGEGWLFLEDEGLRQFAKGNLEGSEEERDAFRSAGRETLIQTQNEEITYYHRSPSHSAGLSLRAKFKTYELTPKGNHLYLLTASSLPSTLTDCSLGIRLPTKEWNLLRTRGVLIDLQNRPLFSLRSSLFLECPSFE